MQNYPRVTIITPSYNQAEFLEETILSVLSQNYPNLEYFIIDGGSTDGSPEIIRKYEDRLAWWVSERDRGQSDAVNKGFARATGEIIGWINSDDYFLPGAIHAAVQAMQEHPDCSIVFGDVLAINGSGEPINVMTFGDWSLDDLMQFKVIGQPSVFIRREALERAGYLDLSYHYLLDHELWLRVVQQGPMYYYRQRWSAARYHAGAKNVSQTDKYGADAYRIIEWMARQPQLSERFQRLKRRIWAGAYCLDAHYQLDGGRARAALGAYLRAFWSYPPAVLQHKRRVLFAAASLFVDIEAVKTWYLKRRKEKLAAELAKNGG
ncbi:MAG: glycosyltransferase [Chloroflexi bacterium]|nr:glycosyltransferase [Chloroflexota bacterium]